MITIAGKSPEGRVPRATSRVLASRAVVNWPRDTAARTTRGTESWHPGANATLPPTSDHVLPPRDGRPIRDWGFSILKRSIRRFASVRITISLPRGTGAA